MLRIDGDEVQQAGGRIYRMIVLGGIGDGLEAVDRSQLGVGLIGTQGGQDTRGNTDRMIVVSGIAILRNKKGKTVLPAWVENTGRFIDRYYLIFLFLIPIAFMTPISRKSS
jgi:hypothetical protein